MDDTTLTEALAQLREVATRLPARRAFGGPGEPEDLAWIVRQLIDVVDEVAARVAAIEAAA